MAVKRSAGERGDETVSAPVTAASTILAISAGALVLAVGVDALTAAIVATVSGTFLTATVTATKRRTPGGRAVGSLLAVLAALGTAGALGLAVGADPTSIGARYRAGVVVAIAVAAFGGTATLTGAVGNRAVRSALPVVLLTPVPVALVAAAFFEPARSRVPGLPGTGAGTDGVLSTGLERLVSPDGAAVGALSFAGLLVGLLWLTALVSPRLPIPELLPRDRRRDARRRIGRIASRAGWAGWLVVFGTTVASGLAVIARADDIQYVDDAHALVESTVVPVAMAPLVRAGVLAGIAALCLAVLCARLPGLYRLRYSPVVRWLPVFTGGTAVAALVAVGYPTVFDRRVRPELESMVAAGESVGIPGTPGEIPPQEALRFASPPEGIALAGGVMIGVVGTIGALLLGIWLLGSFRLLSNRAAPGSLGASALVAGALLAALDGASALVIGSAVGCAIVAWDASVYGVSITEELGRETAVQRPAITHATGALVVGAVGLGLALGLNSLLERLTIRTGVTVAVCLTIALLASFVVLKRRAVARATRVDADRISRHPVTAGAMPGIDAVEARALRKAGFETIGDVQRAPAAELEAVSGLSEETAAAITSARETSPTDEATGETESERGDGASETRTT